MSLKEEAETPESPAERPCEDTLTEQAPSASQRGLNKTQPLGFPGGAVVENPPANAGDTGSSPGPGRSHMPWSNWARAPHLLSLRSRARKPQLRSPRATTAEACVPRARAPQQEKPLH